MSIVTTLKQQATPPSPLAGRLATQLAYWRLQALDWWDEARQARNADRLRV